MDPGLAHMAEAIRAALTHPVHMFVAGEPVAGIPDLRAEARARPDTDPGAVSGPGDVAAKRESADEQAHRAADPAQERDAVALEPCRAGRLRCAPQLHRPIGSA